MKFQLLHPRRDIRWIIMAIICLFVVLRVPGTLTSHWYYNPEKNFSCRLNIQVFRAESFCQGWDNIAHNHDPSHDQFIKTNLLETRNIKRCNNTQNYLPETKKASDRNIGGLVLARFHIWEGTDELSEYFPRIESSHRKIPVLRQVQSNKISWTEKIFRKISAIYFQHTLNKPSLRGNEKLAMKKSDFIHINQILNIIHCSAKPLHYDFKLKQLCGYRLKKNFSIPILNQTFRIISGPENNHFNSFILMRLEFLLKHGEDTRLSITRYLERFPCQKNLFANPYDKLDKSVHKRQANESKDCKSLTGSELRACRKSKDELTILYIFLSFTGASCLLLVAIQCWNRRRQKSGTVKPTPLSNHEKQNREILPVIRAHEMISPPKRQVVVTTPNCKFNGAASTDIKDISLRVDGASDTFNLWMSKQKDLDKPRSATFPLCAAKFRNSAPSISELQLPIPRLASIRRITRFNSDESSNEESGSNPCWVGNSGL